MRTLTLLAMSAISLTVSAPAFAQGAMASGDAMHHMSAADTRMMARCKAMPHDRMMRNKSCARMMRMHPDMMGNNAMMHGDAMNHDAMKPGQ